MSPSPNLRTLSLAFVVALAACGNLLTDAATRLSGDLCREAEALRASAASTRTFEHVPLAHPEGVSGDYRIELLHRDGDAPGESVILVGDSFDGPTRFHTTAHNRCVRLDRSLSAAHRDGGPTVIALEKRGGEIWVVELR